MILSSPTNAFLLVLRSGWCTFPQVWHCTLEIISEESSPWKDAHTGWERSAKPSCIVIYRYCSSRGHGLGPPQQLAWASFALSDGYAVVWGVTHDHTLLQYLSTICSPLGFSFPPILCSFVQSTVAGCAIDLSFLAPTWDFVESLLF
jgi:hypothetical protein